MKRQFLSQSDEQALLDAYRLCWRLQAGSRLLTDNALDMEKLGIGARAFLLRETGQADEKGLAQRLADCLNGSEAVANKVLSGR